MVQGTRVGGGPNSNEKKRSPPLREKDEILWYRRKKKGRGGGLRTMGGLSDKRKKGPPGFKKFENYKGWKGNGNYNFGPEKSGELEATVNRRTTLQKEEWV